MKHALICSGGGARGAAEAGMIAVLYEHYSHTSSPITIVSGTSVGALNAAALTHAVGNGAGADAGDFLVNLWLGIREEDIFRRGRLGKLSTVYRLVRGRALYDSAPLADLVQRTLSTAAISASPLSLHVHATELGKRRQVTATNHSPYLLDAIVASASIPGAFPPRIIGGVPFVDGGVVANTPLQSAIDDGAEMITILYLDDEVTRVRTTFGEAISEATGPAERMSALDAAQRSVETMMAAHLERDLRSVKLYNRLARHGEPGVREIAVRLVRAGPLGSHSGTLDFSRKRIGELLREGRRTALKFLQTP